MRGNLLYLSLNGYKTRRPDNHSHKDLKLHKQRSFLVQKYSTCGVERNKKLKHNFSEEDSFKINSFLRR